MSELGPTKSRVESQKAPASPFHLLRVLKFAPRHRKHLYLGVAATFMVAMLYSLNILAMLPTIKVIADEQGIPAWIDQNAAERRLGVVLAADEGRVRVVKVEKDGPLGPDKAMKDDYLVRVNGQALSIVETYQALAEVQAGAAVTLDLERRGAVAVSAQAVALELPFYLESGRSVASMLPQGTDRASKMKTLVIIVVGILILGFIGAVCRFSGEWLISLVAAEAVMGVRRRMYEKVLRLPMTFFAKHGTSDLIARFVQDSQDIYRGLNFVFAKSLMEPLKALFAFVASLVIDWRITLVILVIAPIAAFFINRIGKMIRKTNRRLLEAYGRMLQALNDALTGIRVVKGYAMERHERRHLSSIDAQILKQTLRIARTEAAASPSFEMLGRVAASFAILFFAYLMFEGLMTFSKFATLGACMAAMFDPIRKMSSFYGRMQRANAAMDRVFEILDMPLSEEDQGPKPSLPPFAESIEFRGLRFTYPGSDTPAVDGVSLTVRRGERVAFVGPNGSGKTTLLSMLVRFHQPDEGAVLIDGRNIQDHSVSSLRKQMSLITQDTVVFADTIACNIAYGDDKLLKKIVLNRRHQGRRRVEMNGCMERIQEAARAAFADEFIREKPEGYDTQIGEHGSTLSGGQKQRIAIARAILRNAPIFIFDEATSQIDAESEQKIHDAVEKFLENRTALIIAHRFSTIREADRIVVMDRGRVVDMGRHEELIQRCALYQSLYGSQIMEDIPTSTPRDVTRV